MRPTASFLMPCSDKPEDSCEAAVGPRSSGTLGGGMACGEPGRRLLVLQPLPLSLPTHPVGSWYKLQPSMNTLDRGREKAGFGGAGSTPSNATAAAGGGVDVGGGGGGPMQLSYELPSHSPQLCPLLARRHLLCWGTDDSVGRGSPGLLTC